MKELKRPTLVDKEMLLHRVRAACCHAAHTQGGCDGINCGECVFDRGHIKEFKKLIGAEDDLC